MDHLTMKNEASLSEPTMDESISSKRSRSNNGSPTSSLKGSPTSKRRKANSLPTETVEYLKAWMMSPEHIAHPYPTEQEKAQIMADTGIELKQLTNWFVNNRKRFWKPRVEARLQEQAHVAAVATNVAPIDIRPAQLNSLSLSNAISANPEVFLAPGAQCVSEPSLSASSSSSSLSQLGANSPSRVVSDQSENESVGSNDDEMVVLNLSSAGQDTTERKQGDDADNLLTQTEYVNVVVLRPASGSIPTIDDVTILNNVPSDRVLRVYEDCTLTYNVPCDSVSNNQEIQYQRDAEIARLKKHYLEVFLSQPLSTQKRGRSYLADTEDVVTPRPKFRRVSVELWKEACQSPQNDYYDSSLPSLEEAATLFGFAQS